MTVTAELPPAELVVRVKTAHERIRTLIDGLTEEQCRAASGLPGWTRGHVLAHLRGFTRGANRQIDYALTDRLIEFYDGGRPGRNAEIAAHADRPAKELVDEVRHALTALDDGWSRVGSSDWSRAVTYRDSTLLAVLQCSWREAEIHAVDLSLGIVPSAWSPEFCAHAIGFLTPRAPAGVQLELTTPDGDTWTLGTGGTGERIGVYGALTDLTAWLAGRKPDGAVVAQTGNLPELAPWP